MGNGKQIGLLVCAVLALSILACRIGTASLGSATAAVPGVPQGMTNAAPTQPINQEIGSGTPLGNSGWSGAGLAGEKVMTLVFDPNSPTTVYAGIYSGFIEKSNDSGGTWQTLSNGLANLKGKACGINVVAGVISCNNTVTNIQTFGSLTIDPQASTTLYGGALEGGMVKSVDGGESWIQINQGLTNSMVTATILDPVSPVTLFIATNGGGISKSMDGGNNWISAGSDIWGVNQFAIDPVSPASVYAATQKGVEKTTDGGASWSLLVNGMDPTDLAIHTIAVDPKTPATIYAGAFSDLYKSVDGGNTWSLSEFRDDQSICQFAGG